MMFEDSKEPFDPNDNLPKPKEGDILVIKSMPEYQVDTTEESRYVKVVGIFDSLAEDWGDMGESAWAQHDLNELVGFRGHWYAIVQEPNDDYTTWVVASWEVERIQEA